MHDSQPLFGNGMGETMTEGSSTRRAARQFLRLVVVVVLWFGTVAARGATNPPAPEKAGFAEGSVNRVTTETDFDQTILWRDGAKSEALFIPQEKWDSRAIEELPLSGSQLEMLRYRLSGGTIEPSTQLAYALSKAPWLDRRTWLAEQRAKGAHEVRDCEQPQEHFRSTQKLPAGEPIPLAELIRANELGFVGEIVAVVPGATPTGFPQEAVYLRIVEILQDLGHRFRVGAVIPRLRTYGRVVIQGQELCVERPPQVEDTGVEDTVLVGGRVELPGPGVLYQQFELRLQGDAIEPTSSVNTSEPLPPSLPSLRAALVGKRPGPERPSHLVEAPVDVTVQQRDGGNDDE